MHGRFTKGIIIGGIVGASVSAIMEMDMMKKKRRRAMSTGRRLIRASSHIINDFSSMFR